MNKITVNGDKRMTLKEIAKTTGAAYSTVAAYAQRAGWTENGKQTLLDELQTTIIIEAMKRSTGQGGKRAAAGKEHLPLAMEGIDTSKSRALRIDLLHRQIETEMQTEINELKSQIVCLETAHKGTKALLSEREFGLEIIQRIAESGGLIASDRDDVLAAYGRKQNRS